MGSGATRTQNIFQSKNNLFQSLSNDLDQLATQLDLLSSAQFNTVDEMIELDIKKSIDLLQNQINGELITVRKEVKNMKNNPLCIFYEGKLNEFNTQSQNLYMKVSEIIKGKIKPSD